MFQNNLDEGYEDIPNVTSIADDISVFGSTEQEHVKLPSNDWSHCQEQQYIEFWEVVV